MNNTLDLLCMGCFAQLSAPNTRCPVCGYTPPSDAEGQHRLAPRTVLSGKYMVGKPLGEGGFGITYLGYDLNLDIKVAIKEFYPFGFVTRSGTQSTTVQPLAGEQGEFFLKGRERFVDEAKRLAKFRTFPGIVMVNDFFVENGTAYIVMEYVEGETLKSYMAQQGGRLPSEMVLAMMRPVFESLAQIHAEGLIHRDISPDNIMVTHSGEVKLLDFGAAREFGEDGNKSLSVMLKHGYAPPEQYTSRGVQGPHTDVYALCATIYKAITGVTPDGSMDRLMEDRLVPPSVLGAQMPYHAEVALMHGLAVKAEHRWQTMGDLYAALYNSQIHKASELAYHNSQLPYPQDAAPQVYQQPVGGGVYDAPQVPSTSYAPQSVGRDALGAPPSQYGQPPSTSYTPQQPPATSYAPQPHGGRQDAAPTGEKEVVAHFEPQPTGEAVYPAPVAKPNKPMTAGKRGSIIAAAVGGCVVIALVIALTARQGAPVDSTQTDDPGESIGMMSPSLDPTTTPTPEPDAQQVTESYEFVTELTQDATLVNADFLTVRAYNDRTVTITISNIPVNDTYITNLDSSKKNSSEYNWDVEMHTDKNAFSVSTTNWAFEPGLNEEKSVTQMQHSVAVRTENNTWSFIGDAEMSYTADSITWSFTMPDEYPFDFTQVTRYWVNVQNVPDEVFIMREYLPASHTAVPILTPAPTIDSNTVIATGLAASYLSGFSEWFSEWQDIAAVSAGGNHIVGLKTDGTAVAVGGNSSGERDVSDWRDIVAISAGSAHTVGLKSDGTVVAAGDGGYGMDDVSGWRDIVAISAGGWHTVGLKTDGTVVAAGENFDGECDVSSWQDIVAISAGGNHTVGLKSDGTVVAVGFNGTGLCDVSDWRDIVAISASHLQTVGLKSDGTVVFAGGGGYGIDGVSDWRDIVAIATGSFHTVGLKSDGTVVAVGSNESGQCNVSDWRGIVAISAGDNCTVGIQASPGA